MPNWKAGFEPRDVNVRLIVLAGLGILGVGVLIQAVLASAFLFLSHARALHGQNIGVPPSEFREGRHPRARLTEYRRKMRRELSTFGWADRKNGKVRIPIDQAMEKFAHDQ